MMIRAAVRTWVAGENKKEGQDVRDGQATCGVEPGDLGRRCLHRAMRAQRRKAALEPREAGRGGDRPGQSSEFGGASLQHQLRVLMK